MSTPVVAFAIFDRLLAAIGLIREEMRRKSQRTDKSLYALYTALIETKSYMTYLRSGNKKDRDREETIARFWHDASVPLRKVDRDLAERCFLKGSYWLEPDTWSASMIENKRIGLEQVIESTHELLIEK